MNISRRRLLILLPAAAVAWESVLAGTPESSPNYKMSEHWWSMLIDIPSASAAEIVYAHAKSKTMSRKDTFVHGLSAIT
jgi:hypothetical protein